MRRLSVSLALLSSLACGGNDNKPSDNVASFAGNYQGNYTVTSCSQSGTISLANLCGSYPNGTALQWTLQTAQSDRSVTGTAYLGTLDFAVNSQVASDNTLTITSANSSGGTAVASTRWVLRKSGAGITGTIQTTFESIGLTGTAVLTGNIPVTNRSSATAPAAATTGTRIAPRSLDEMRDAITATP